MTYMDATSPARLGGLASQADVPLLSFDDVYSQHADSILRFSAIQMRDPVVAQDVTSDTFVKAFQAYNRVRPAPADVKLWLLRIARNTGIDYQRRARRAVLFSRRPWQEQTTDVEQAAETRGELQSLIAAAGRLRARERELVAMRASGFGYSEIAQVMNMTAEGARQATVRAMDRLRVKYEELCNG
jgi:RNA polymerase sigma-70 factor (ECF subfamily)